LIVANDIEFKRLKEIPKRANRCGIISIQTHFLDLRNKRNELLNLNKKKLFDKVLVDAPCSGSGTIRRDPMKKYRINDKLISKLSENQLNILEYYSKYVKKNGILVYSTCSILPQENKNIVSSFLKLHPEFIPDDISNSLEKFNIKVGRLENNFMFSIDFRDANSDGFFMAKLRRI
jgi:16S rRNA (cytosine967-C5)-methyltransferase